MDTGHSQCRQDVSLYDETDKDSKDLFDRRHAKPSFDAKRERERLGEQIEKCLTECGWVALLESKCYEYIRVNGVENGDEEDMIKEVKKDLVVPENAKREIMVHIREFVIRCLMECERRGRGPSNA